MDLEDTYDYIPQPDIDWSLLFYPSEWYITPTVIQENFKSLAASLLFSALCALVFYFARSQGIQRNGFWGEMRFARLRFSDRAFMAIWLLMYIPLAIGAWLVYMERGNEWGRSLTIYTLHMAVNVLFPISLWWVQDLSLALLNLLTLIGVAMFTTSQFGKVLYFASYINTPYLLFLLIYLIEFCYFWYLNEGQELMDIANMQAAKTVGKKIAPSAASGADAAANGSSSTSTASPGMRRKKRAGPPAHIKDKLKRRLRQRIEDESESSS